MSLAAPEPEFDMKVLAKQIEKLRAKEQKPIYPHITINEERENSILFLTNANRYMGIRLCSHEYLDEFEGKLLSALVLVGYFNSPNRDSMIDYCTHLISQLMLHVRSGIELELENEGNIHGFVRALERELKSLLGENWQC